VGRITIASLTDHEATPSSRFRVRQLEPFLKAKEIELFDLPRKYSSQRAAQIFPNKRIKRSFIKFTYALLQEIGNVMETGNRIRKASSSDYTLISREIIDNFPSFERCIKNKIIFDIDDAVFIGRPQCHRKTVTLLNRSPIVFAGNTYLSNWCKQFTKNVHEVPTAVDLSKFKEKEKKPKSKFIVGWQGTSSSFQFLKNIEKELKEFFSTHNNCELYVSSDRYPEELTEIHKYIEFKKWNKEDEVNHIQEYDVGIMPIEESEYSLGKCAYKMLLYLSCGVPACVTSWGMNKEILNKGKVGIGVEKENKWNEALDYFYKNRSNLDEIFPDCRKVVKDFYSVESVVRKIEKVLRT